MLNHEIKKKKSNLKNYQSEKNRNPKNKNQI
jgi:hypothetical protein